MTPAAVDEKNKSMDGGDQYNPKFIPNEEMQKKKIMCCYGWSETWFKTRIQIFQIKIFFC